LAGVVIRRGDISPPISSCRTHPAQHRQQFGEKWQLLGDLQYTNWSKIGKVNVINSNTGQTADVLALDFEDAWRIALGVNYISSEKWTFRGGVACDQSPVNDDNRTVRLPDNDRIWLSIGAQYRFGKGVPGRLTRTCSSSRPTSTSRAPYRAPTVRGTMTTRSTSSVSAVDVL
jgi:long-chain fatty acid transport protein